MLRNSEAGKRPGTVCGNCSHDEGNGEKYWVSGRVFLTEGTANAKVLGRSSPVDSWSSQRLCGGVTGVWVRCRRYSQSIHGSQIVRALSVLCKLSSSAEVDRSHGRILSSVTSTD